MKRNQFLRVFVCLIGFVTLLSAQVQESDFAWNSDFRSSAYFQSWKKENGDRISQWSIPVHYILPLSRTLSVDIATGLASANRTTADDRLEGLVDTRIRTTFLTLREKLLLTAYLTFPTGVNRLEGDQNKVASALSDDALNFRMPNFGQGFRVNIGGVYATQVSAGVVLGLGAAYLWKGAFKPFANNELNYRPGNELAFTMGLDLGGERFKMTADAAYIYYQADKADDEVIFRSGDKLFLQLRWIFNLQPSAITVYVQNRSKGKNERGFGSISEELLNSNGNRLDIGSIGSFPVNSQTTLKALLSVKIYAKNEYGDRGALIGGIGGGVVHHFSRRVSLDLTGKLSRGNQKTLGSKIGITGLEFSGGFRYRL